MFIPANTFLWILDKGIFQSLMMWTDLVLLSKTTNFFKRTFSTVSATRECLSRTPSPRSAGISTSTTSQVTLIGGIPFGVSIWRIVDAIDFYIWFPNQKCLCAMVRSIFDFLYILCRVLSPITDLGARMLTKSKTFPVESHLLNCLSLSSKKEMKW